MITNFIRKLKVLFSIARPANTVWLNKIHLSLLWTGYDQFHPVVDLEKGGPGA